MFNPMQKVPDIYIRKLPGTFSREVLKKQVQELLKKGFKLKVNRQQSDTVVYWKIHNRTLKEYRSINFSEEKHFKSFVMDFKKLATVQKIFQKCICKTKATRKTLNSIKVNAKGELEDKDYRKLDGVFEKLNRLLKRYSPLIKAIQVPDPFSLEGPGFTLGVLPASPDYRNDLKTYFSFIETMYETRHLLATRPGRPLGRDAKTQALHTLARKEYHRLYRVNRYESHAAICDEVHTRLIKSDYSITGKTLQTILRPLRNQLKQSRKKLRS